jgi:hypothetical protein
MKALKKSTRRVESGLKTGALSIDDIEEFQGLHRELIAAAGFTPAHFPNFEKLSQLLHQVATSKKI